MKYCPMCGSATFDDAQTCYECLHSFLPEEAAPELGDSAMNGSAGREADDVEAGCPDDDADALPVTFMLSFAPTRDERGAKTWSCSVEPVPA